MAIVEIRQRAGYLFVAVIVGHIILISAQVNAKSGVPVLEQVTFGLFAEVQRGASAFVGGVRHTWTGYVTPRGVVGRVVTPTARASKVQLLIDRNAAAGVLIERSRAQGVALGSGDDRLRLEYVAETGDVIVGDVVVTSGIDGIYPKGLTVGRVESVDKNGAYRQITVRPAVDFSSLEDVLVILTPTAAKEVAQETAR